jgi:hypothetical protein
MPHTLRFTGQHQTRGQTLLCDVASALTSDMNRSGCRTQADNRKRPQKSSISLDGSNTHASPAFCVMAPSDLHLQKYFHSILVSAVMLHLLSWILPRKVLLRFVTELLHLHVKSGMRLAHGSNAEATEVPRIGQVGSLVPAKYTLSNWRVQVTHFPSLPIFTMHHGEMIPRQYGAPKHHSKWFSQRLAPQAPLG